MTLASLRAALEFYADPKNWQPRGHAQIDADTVPVQQDKGATARRALGPRDWANNPDVSPWADRS